MCFKVTGMLGPPVRYKYLLLAIYPSSTGTTRGILQLMSTPGERSEPQASEASPSRAKRGTLRRAKRGSEIVKSIELSAAPRRFTSNNCNPYSYLVARQNLLQNKTCYKLVDCLWMGCKPTKRVSPFRVFWHRLQIQLSLIALSLAEDERTQRSI